MQASSTALVRVRACLEAPGPLAFHHVKHVRGSMLLLELAAALMAQLAACEMLLEDSQARTSLVTGTHLRLLVRQQQMQLQMFGVHSCVAAGAASNLRPNVQMVWACRHWAACSMCT
jgi:hypothetical protein